MTIEQTEQSVSMVGRACRMQSTIMAVHVASETPQLWPQMRILQAKDILPANELLEFAAAKHLQVAAQLPDL